MIKKNLKCLCAFLAMVGAFLFTSCKDEENQAKEIPNSSIEQVEDTEDQREASEEGIDEANRAFSGTSMGRVGSTPCNVTKTVDETNKTITLTFAGDNCASTRTRTGVVKARLINGSKWSAVGATMELWFENFVVTKKSTNKTLVLNGRKIITNVNGGIVPTATRSVVHTIHGTMTIKFENGMERKWTVARKRTLFYGEEEKWSWKVEADSVGNISEAGTNREGKEFVTTIPSAVMIKRCSSTGGVKAVSGEVVHSVGTSSLSVKLGYKSISEKAESCDATGMLLTYTDPNTSFSEFREYK